MSGETTTGRDLALFSETDQELEPAGETANLQEEKAAILLAALGPEHAARILAGLNEATLRRTAHAIARLRGVSPSRLEAIIHEFLAAMGAEKGVYGGVDEAKRILAGVVDDSTMARIMSDVDGHMRRSIWEQLGTCADSAIARFLQSEHPQTAAVVLAELSSGKAAAVLERLEQDLAQAVVLRLSRVPRLEDRVIKMVEDVLVRDFLSALQQEMATRKPAEVIGGLMNNVGSETRERLLRHLEETRPALAQDVVKVMFSFTDIPARLEPRDVALLARALEEETLMTALKHGDTLRMEASGFILDNLSRRLAERYREDIAAMADVKQRDGEAAQTRVVQTIQDLAKRGEVQLLDVDQA